MDQIRQELDDRIMALLDDLEHLTPGTLEYDQAAASLERLCAIRNADKTASREKRDTIFKGVQAAGGVILGALQLVEFRRQWKEGLIFEKTGNIVSQTVRNRFKPKLLK